MFKKILKILAILAGLYLVICFFAYVFQEQLIFFPEKLESSYKFKFSTPHEELSIRTRDNKNLSAILFKAENARGLIFYLHGNAGSLRSWGDVSSVYTNLGYDVFMLDYRGYGKSEGKISSQSQFFEDVQEAYNEAIKRYDQNRIIILGYSIGTGPATYLASTNQPKMLILQAPYLSLIDLMHHSYPFLPATLLKYRFETNKYIQDCSVPIFVFHGDQDEVIYYESSIKLQRLMKKTDRLITLHGQGHNGITDNPQYQSELKNILQ